MRTFKKELLIYRLLLPVIDISGLMRLFSNKGLGMMVESMETLGIQGKDEDLIKMRREGEKGMETF